MNWCLYKKQKDLKVPENYHNKQSKLLPEQKTSIDFHLNNQYNFPLLYRFVPVIILNNKIGFLFNTRIGN